MEQLYWEGEDVVAAFLIEDPPLGMELQVTVKPLPAFDAYVLAGQIAGPIRFSLDTQHTEEVVDFRIWRTSR